MWETLAKIHASNAKHVTWQGKFHMSHSLTSNMPLHEMNPIVISLNPKP